MHSQTKSYTIGDVIYVAFFPHQEDKSRGEPRWVICLEDFINRVKVVPLTKALENQRYYPKSFIIQKDSRHGKCMGLTNDSLIIPERVGIIPKVNGFINGKCPNEILERIKKLI